MAKQLNISPWSVSSLLFESMFWFPSAEMKTFFSSTDMDSSHLTLNCPKVRGLFWVRHLDYCDTWGKAWCIAMSQRPILGLVESPMEVANVSAHYMETVKAISLD